MDSGAGTAFLLITGHGEFRRASLAPGTVILSQLNGGTSSATAPAPCVQFVLHGAARYELGSRSRRLGPGEFMLMDAGAEFRMETPRTGAVQLGVQLSPAFAQGNVVGPATWAGSASDPLAVLMKHYARLLSENPAAGPELAPRIVHEVGTGAADYCRRFFDQLQRLQPVKQSTRVNTLQRLERARDFIHANADRQLALDEVASHAALSRFHLTRSFTDAFGLPPLAYHRSLRLDKAAMRLRQGASSPTSLSEELGYASLSAFTRAFRQRFGVPPSRLAASA